MVTPTRMGECGAGLAETESVQRPCADFTN